MTFKTIIIAILVSVSIAASAQQEEVQVDIVEQQTPVVLISIDGFAFYYLQKFKPKTLLKLIDRGTTNSGLQPVYPSKTFPNHISMITGKYPNEHGIVHNTFYHRELNAQYYKGAAEKEPAWLTAEPIWSIAEKQNIKTGVYFWPESFATRVAVPSYNFYYDSGVDNKKRLDQILFWLRMPADQKPGFMATYFSSVDTAGHLYGPESEEVKLEIEKLDNLLGDFVDALDQEFNNEVNLIIVSDHGMVSAGEPSAVYWQDIISAETLERLTNVTNGQTQLLLYGDSKTILDARSQLLRASERENKTLYDVYLAREFPKHWHMEKETPQRPDLIVDARPPYTFINTNGYVQLATHGYDGNQYIGLDAIFIGYGPDFKARHKVDKFEVTTILS